MDKERIIVIAVIVLFFLTGTYFVWQMVGPKKEDSDSEEQNSFDLPDTTAKSNFDRRLQAYNEKEKEKASSYDINLEELEFEGTDSAKTKPEPASSDLSIADEGKKSDVKKVKTETPKTSSYQPAPKQVQSSSQKPTVTQSKPTRTSSQYVTQDMKPKSTTTTQSIPSHSEDENEVRTGFYTSKQNVAPSKSNKRQSTEFTAVTHGEQSIKNNSKVKIRITQALIIDDVEIPSNTIILGTASLSDIRLNINITSLTHNNQLINVALGVYDKQDGERGLIVQQASAFNKDAAQEGAGLSGGVKVSSPIISFSTDALKKKVSERSVTLPNNYPVILKITKND